MSDKQFSERLFPASTSKPAYKMPDYAYVHKEIQRSGVTLNLLWLEYCDQCRSAGEISYQSTQFNKYYADYLAKANATMHLNHKPGELMQVDWAGDTAAVIDTDTGEVIPAYVFVATPAVQRLQLCGSFLFYEPGGMDHCPCECLQILRWCHPDHPV